MVDTLSQPQQNSIYELKPFIVACLNFCYSFGRGGIACRQNECSYKEHSSLTVWRNVTISKTREFTTNIAPKNRFVLIDQ